MRLTILLLLVLVLLFLVGCKAEQQNKVAKQAFVVVEETRVVGSDAFIAVYKWDTSFEELRGEPVGVSELLEPGVHREVFIAVIGGFEAGTVPLYAQMHYDTDNSRSFSRADQPVVAVFPDGSSEKVLVRVFIDGEEEEGGLAEELLGSSVIRGEEHDSSAPASDESPGQGVSSLLRQLSNLQ